jgi:hypothetical protein
MSTSSVVFMAGSMLLIVISAAVTLTTLLRHDKNESK